MNKKSLSERDICTKFITPNLVAAGWDLDAQIREEVGFTHGRIYVRGKIHARGAQKRVDYILYYKPNIPFAILRPRKTKTAWVRECSRPAPTPPTSSKSSSKKPSPRPQPKTVP